MVYGGGGIYPDVMLAERPLLPKWVMRVDEQELPLTWSGGYIDANAASLTSLDAFVSQQLPERTLADFRGFAAKQGVVVPSDADALLQDVLLRSIAYAKWGSEGAYRMIAQRDAAIRQAVAAFARATELLHGGT